MKKNDGQWQKAQETIFVDWINDTLKPDIIISNLEEDLKTGVNLILLVEKLTNKHCSEKIIENPKFRIQNISNCTVALRFIEKVYKIKPLCSAENIVNGNSDFKYLLGLLFQIYMNHHKSNLLSPQLSQQQQYEIILKWLQDILNLYEIDLSTTNKMMENFFNGKILIALLDLFFDQHHYFYDWMLKRGEGERIGLSMRMAHDLLGVSELLTTEDVLAHTVDFRVFCFYFEFLMNAFKNKSSVIQIDLVQLVQQAFEQLSKQTNQEKKQSKEEEVLTNQINLPPKQPKKKCASVSSQKVVPISSPSIQTKSEVNQHPQEQNSFKPIVLKDVMQHGRVKECIDEPISKTFNKKNEENSLKITSEKTIHKTKPLPPPKKSTEITLTTFDVGKSGLRHRKHLHTNERSHRYSRTEDPYSITQIYSSTSYSTNGRITTTSEITETTEIQQNETIVFNGFWLI
ncbi:calponin domain family protein, putative [Entamoeba histolytica HM-1:IMSS-B]|uniref:Calponin homology domain protein, putative n=6 Tax=Entamoeba histolytica TaxID=5759 RepID=C4M1Y5_ENTH1|nr:calponin homology domain protein, putative [Entamoeba histolytica HM-1:IMSS]EMD44699.1 calponin domain protein [Entamoeba histolytica KU27]EMH73101.1 calponin domain family protein, putative [Entamoeba histolytica HM-1:IMSS-B]EMS16126.1 calponin domain family protein [Entamoeba histolytica HM-3:IMSS]ENY63390.1 calponin domain family protein [Entamoeba histolytica HM-1:IMSS-A]GAT95257.1 calponin homology domain protein putative [Entamoeba histolytica]|eukprot:XP_655206.1 calponin homology domain protein, putative [Entamoeba histolytica HM-1:IMSS]